MSSTRDDGPDRRSTGTIAELTVAAEGIRSYQVRIGAMATSWRDRAGEAGDDDVVAAIFEAERSLGVAERAIRRALKVAGRP
jgi:hypothetical protein